LSARPFDKGPAPELHVSQPFARRRLRDAAALQEGQGPFSTSIPSTSSSNVSGLTFWWFTSLLILLSLTLPDCNSI
jgi:hypothetical protein